MIPTRYNTKYLPPKHNNSSLRFEARWSTLCAKFEQTIFCNLVFLTNNAHQPTHLCELLFILLGHLTKRRNCIGPGWPMTGIVCSKSETQDLQQDQGADGNDACGRSSGLADRGAWRGVDRPCFWGLTNHSVGSSTHLEQWITTPWNRACRGNHTQRSCLRKRSWCKCPASRIVIRKALLHVWDRSPEYGHWSNKGPYAELTICIPGTISRVRNIQVKIFGDILTISTETLSFGDLKEGAKGKEEFILRACWRSIPVVVPFCSVDMKKGRVSRSEIKLRLCATLSARHHILQQSSDAVHSD
ncbi:hypothetical protein KCU65_g4, partial [Aureobasidium melanogenum]